MVSLVNMLLYVMMVNLLLILLFIIKTKLNLGNYTYVYHVLLVNGSTYNNIACQCDPSTNNSPSMIDQNSV